MPLSDHIFNIKEIVIDLFIIYLQMNLYLYVQIWHLLTSENIYD